jgi:putative IMPACT (imprinted ancient) family translation regulator
MKELASVKLVEQRSRFFAHLYRIESPEEVEEILKLHRREYKTANHHCWAMFSGGREKSKDDGEVGHPGKVLLEILKKHDLDSHALVVSRVFGGVKLGVGGVSRAFREAGEGAVVASEK